METIGYQTLCRRYDFESASHFVVFGKILFVEDTMMFQASIIDSNLLRQLESDGHYFAGENCHTNPLLQGYVLDSKVILIYIIIYQSGL
jgi:hypothetical protein